MIDLSGISEVMQRIQTIENRFGVHHSGGSVNFQQTLQSEMEGGKVAPENSQKPASDRTRTFEETGEKSASKSMVDMMITSAAKKYGVDSRLVSAVAETESGYSPNAVSNSGAVGVMQLMPDTAATLGVDPYDTQQNIEGGTKYLKNMLDDFGGDVRKAVAAYNAGTQAVKDYNGVPPYAETQNYVNKVLDLYR
ncbi:MAG: lytic transglycosylase domain-containing protein [Selenomonadaceae bacterium]